jgi:peptide/nickel transport system ATP-binding protein
MRSIPEPETPVLSIRGYTLDYLTAGVAARALADIDLEIGAGEVVGLVGESGSGKSSLAWAIMRALPSNAIESAGTIRLSGADLMREPPANVASMRGRRIGMVFQDPATSLNPTLTLGEQVAETLRRHRGMNRASAWAEGVRLLDRVGLRGPDGMMRRYPHEASGGEKQRVVIASAFACRPECILFDEPTTALDVITARQILDLLAELQRETKVASLYISHDLATVSLVAGRVAVISEGRIVESGPVGEVFARPRADYTRKLIAAVPQAGRRLVDDDAAGADVLVRARDLSVRYGRPSLIDDLLRRERKSTMGADKLGLDVHAGEIVGVVGESGSGKSTLARALTGLAAFEGELGFGGRSIRGRADMDRDYRRDVQIVFQHPDSSLNPRHRVGEILSRPLALYGASTSADRGSEIGRLLEAVRLPRDFAARYPHQLSGGQKQRVAIARAFASRPRLVICDEVTSSLDVSVQAAVIELLVELRRTTGAAYLFISHDINLVRQIAHRIVVMRAGLLVETISTSDLASRGPTHPYTAALLAAVPAIGGPRIERETTS